MDNTTSLGNSSGSNSSKPLSPFTSSLGLAIVIVLAAEIPIGFLGNLKVCFLLYKRKELRKVPHVLLGNLSLIGLLVSSIYIPLFLVVIVTVQFFRKPLHALFCILRYSSSLLFFGLQAFTLVAMAMDRHDCVVRPLKRRITATNVRKIVKGIWLVAGLITLLHFPLAVNDAMHSCVMYTLNTPTVSTTFTLVMSNFYLFGAVIVIFVTFVRIVRKLRSLPFAAATHNNTEIQVTRFSYKLMLFFLISWFPLVFFTIISSAARLEGSQVEGLKVLVLALSNFNYLVNPFVHMNIVKLSRRSVGPDDAVNGNKEQLKHGCRTCKSEASREGMATKRLNFTSMTRYKYKGESASF